LIINDNKERIDHSINQSPLCIAENYLLTFRFPMLTANMHYEINGSIYKTFQVYGDAPIKFVFHEVECSIMLFTEILEAQRVVNKTNETTSDGTSDGNSSYHHLSVKLIDPQDVQFKYVTIINNSTRQKLQTRHPILINSREHQLATVVFWRLAYATSQKLKNYLPFCWNESLKKFEIKMRKRDENELHLFESTNVLPFVYYFPKLMHPIINTPILSHQSPPYVWNAHLPFHYKRNV
jgi:hypothetical protein